MGRSPSKRNHVGTRGNENTQEVASKNTWGYGEGLTEAEASLVLTLEV